jgi:hypothetical protein
MKQTYLFFLILIAFLFNSLKGHLFEIGPKIISDNRITLTDIADDILYIPLDNSIPIGLTYKMIITKDYIYISVKDVGILKFDRFGKLICKIGSYGRGPGEYNYFMDFAVDETKGNVFVLDHKIKVYSQTGHFLRDINYKNYLSYMGGNIEIFNSLLFIPDFIRDGSSKFNWVFLDTLGRMVNLKENSVPNYTVNMVPPGQVYKFGNNLFYFNSINDTIFSISPDLKCTGAYLFSQGDHRFPRKNFVFQSVSELNRFFKPVKMFETKYFIFLEYSYLDRWVISLIDKKTKKVLIAYRPDKSSGIVKTRALIENDLDCGMPFSSRPIIYYYEENGIEHISTLRNSYDLKVYLSTDVFKNSIPKYPQKKKELVKLANSLKETDNPVLMIVRLKK